MGKLGHFIVVLYIVNKLTYLTCWKLKYFLGDCDFFKRVFLGPINQWNSNGGAINPQWEMFLKGIQSFLESLVLVVNLFL